MLPILAYFFGKNSSIIYYFTIKHLKIFCYCAYLSLTFYDFTATN